MGPIDFDSRNPGSLVAPPPVGQGGGHAHIIKQNLRRLDRKDSWYWWNAVLVITLLMGAIVVLSLPRLLPADDPSFQLELSLAIRGLLGLVLIFNVYTLYQQHLLRQLRNSLAGQIEIATEQKVRAEALYEQAVIDPLTGLFNRRFSDERLQAEISRADQLSPVALAYRLGLNENAALTLGSVTYALAAAFGVVLMIIEIIFAKRKKGGFNLTDRQRVMGIFGVTLFATALVMGLIWMT